MLDHLPESDGIEHRIRKPCAFQRAIANGLSQDLCSVFRCPRAGLDTFGVPTGQPRLLHEIAGRRTNIEETIASLGSWHEPEPIPKRRAMQVSISHVGIVAAC